MLRRYSDTSSRGSCASSAAKICETAKRITSDQTENLGERRNYLQANIVINVENPFRETEYQVEVFCAKLLQISDCRVELVMDVLFLKTQTIGAGYQRYMR